MNKVDKNVKAVNTHLLTNGFGCTSTWLPRLAITIKQVRQCYTKIVMFA